MKTGTDSHPVPGGAHHSGPGARFTTGQTIHVNGGAYLGG